MSTPFLTALSGYIEAERNFASADERWRLEQGDGAHLSGIRDAYASMLAQAGDALEGELRRMMREQVNEVRDEIWETEA